MRTTYLQRGCQPPAEYLEDYHTRTLAELKGITGSLNKIRKLIWTHFHVYATNRVFARILLIEVRNHSNYFTSETYSLVKNYSNILLGIIEDGIQSGELRDDIPPKTIRQSILGSIEHICLTGIVFKQEIATDQLSKELCDILFHGIEK